MIEREVILRPFIHMLVFPPRTDDETFRPGQRGEQAPTVQLNLGPLFPRAGAVCVCGCTQGEAIILVPAREVCDDALPVFRVSLSTLGLDPSEY